MQRPGHCHGTPVCAAQKGQTEQITCAKGKQMAHDAVPMAIGVCHVLTHTHTHAGICVANRFLAAATEV